VRNDKTPDGGIVILVIRIKIPAWLERIGVRLVLVYRRLRFSYTFRKIPLTQGQYAIVDPDDYPRLAKYKWRICRTKGKNVTYAERSIRLPNGKYSRTLMHREVLSLPALSKVEVSKGQLTDVPVGTPAGPPPRREGYVIDHINGSGLDNRRANLRPATVAQNAQNSRRRKNLSGYKGVWFDKHKRKWRAAIWHNSKRVHLGYFSSPRQAANAYDEAAKKYHGEFACLNLSQNIKPEPVRRSLSEGRTKPRKSIIVNSLP